MGRSLQVIGQDNRERRSGPWRMIKGGEIIIIRLWDVLTRLRLISSSAHNGNLPVGHRSSLLDNSKGTWKAAVSSRKGKKSGPRGYIIIRCRKETEISIALLFPYYPLIAVTDVVVTITCNSNRSKVVIIQINGIFTEYQILIGVVVWPYLQRLCLQAQR